MVTASVPVPDPATDVPAETDFAVDGEWLVGNVGRCTCDGGGEFPHRWECGWAPVAKVDVILKALAPMVSRMVADAERAARVAALDEAVDIAQGNDGDETFRLLRELLREAQS